MLPNCKLTMGIYTKNNFGHHIKITLKSFTVKGFVVYLTDLPA